MGNQTANESLEANSIPSSTVTDIGTALHSIVILARGQMSRCGKREKYDLESLSSFRFSDGDEPPERAVRGVSTAVIVHIRL